MGTPTYSSESNAGVVEQIANFGRYVGGEGGGG